MTNINMLVSIRITSQVALSEKPRGIPALWRLIMTAKKKPQMLKTRIKVQWRAPDIQVKNN